MKKRSLFALCLLALVGIVLFVSCIQDPILDNKAIGKWTAENNMGEKITLDVKSDQKLLMTLEQTDGTYALFFGIDDDNIVINVTGKWDATSVSEGTMTLDGFGTNFTFTAYDKVLTLYNSEMGKIEFSRM